MKRKLSALLVLVLTVVCLTSCSLAGVKSTVRDIVGDDLYLKMAHTYHDIRDAIEK